MKQLLRRVVIKDGVAIKQLPYVMEHDAVKAVFIENELQQVHISPEYKLKNGISDDISDDIINVFHLTIKWVDGETSNITITEESGDQFFNFVYISFDNIYDAEINHGLNKEEDDEDDEDAEEEEIEEEVLDDGQLKLAFPSNAK